MSKNKKPIQPAVAPLKKSFLLYLAFLLPVLYWIYLASLSEMIIADDAKSYELLGRLLYEEGWKNYLVTGPNREPLYPLLIAFSMFIADRLSFSYQTIMIFLHLSLLFVTQLLTLKIMKRLRIPPWIQAAAVFYLGVSPALVNSAFRLFSEITAYPLVLLVILGVLRSWRTLFNYESGGKTGYSAFLLGCSLVLLTSVKGITELMVLVCATPLMIYSFLPILKNQRNIAASRLVFVFVLLMTYFVPTTLYKTANKTLNGHFTLTDRGAYILYGTAAQRTEAFSARRVLTALTMTVPSIEFCWNFFSEEECLNFSFYRYNDLSNQKLAELDDKGLTGEKRDHTMIRQAVGLALAHPLAYGVFYFIETLKMLFWESPSQQYVIYPENLGKLYRWQIIPLILYTAVPLLTLFAVLFTSRYLRKERRSPDPTNRTEVILLAGILTFIAVYILTHAFFHLIDRYSLPLAPLHLILIAWMLKQLTAQPSSVSKKVAKS